ncbi:MAG TPA: chemotaxis protein CheW, partial [Acetobacteraceae bacterium]|nr:chemotaxis protein CheW [Acetobacteraceae bacterium]
TDLSGRGVGMDAVRAAIGRLGGLVSVRSRPGEGTTVRFTLPFTVMMSQVMTVEVAGQVFGIPFDSVAETIRLPREAVMPFGAARAFALRDRTVPLIDLAELLAMDGGTAGSREPPLASLVVIETAGRLGALEVERFGERLEVMLKPMEGLLAGMPGVSGTTLLGDGRVLIVLDPGELLR